MSPASAGRKRRPGTSPTELGSWRRVVRLLAPEPERAADSGEHRRDRRFVEPGVLTASRHSVARLLLADPLDDLPDAPTENGVTAIDNPHVLSFPRGRA